MSEAAASTRLDAVIEYVCRDVEDGNLWLDIVVDRQLWAHLGPYETEAERHAAKADLLNMMRQLGARDMPERPQ